MSNSWCGSALFAPAKTPPEVVNKLHAALMKVLATDAMKADFARDGIDIVTDESPEAFRKVIAGGYREMGQGHQGREHPAAMTAAI